MSHDVFICHAFEDADSAAEICERLEKSGLQCWIAPRDPVAGIPYGRQLVEAIAGARVLLLVFSEAANDSVAVLSELELATARGKDILPVRIADVMPSANLEFYVRSIHWFDAVSRSIEDAAPDLAQHLTILLSREDSGESAGRAADSPAAVRTITAAHNLPEQLTTFVGREREIGEIEEALAAARLVTVLGAGGIGKTRCALRAAEESLDGYRDGAWFVDLSRVSGDAFVTGAIASTFGLRESPNRPLLETLLAYLKHKDLLLVLDNCEHVVAEVARVAEAILRECPKLSLLATSREPLAIGGECVLRMPTLGAEEAFALFADRARNADRRFTLTDEIRPLVAEICKRLDGIALAIELAAARVKVLSVKAIAEKLDTRFRLLAGGGRDALPRQQTLRAAIDWSYDLLSELEQTAFRRIGIFAADFTLEAATSTCCDERLDELDALDVFTSLVDKSLVQAEIGRDPVRYSLLESTREYAREKLIESGEYAAMAGASARTFTAIAERLGDEWDTAPDARWREAAGLELANFRAALAWSLHERADVALAQRLALALRPIWYTLALSEGLRWIREAIAAADTPHDIVARLELAAAHLSISAVQYKAAVAGVRRARALLERRDGPDWALAQLVEGAAMAASGEAAEGERMLRESLEWFREHRSRRWTGAALVYLAGARHNAGDVPGALERFAEARDLLRALGGPGPAGHITLLLAEAEFQRGDAKAAIGLALEALDDDRSQGDQDSVAFDLCNLAAYRIALGHWDDAARNARDALALAREREIGVVTVASLQHLAAISALRPDGERPEPENRRQAARVLAYVDAQYARAELQRDFTEQHEYEAATKALEDALGTMDLSSLASEGSSWDQERAFTEALRL